jgi:hypothetical protein
MAELRGPCVQGFVVSRTISLARCYLTLSKDATTMRIRCLSANEAGVVDAEDGRQTS